MVMGRLVVVTSDGQPVGSFRWMGGSALIILFMLMSNKQ